MAKQFLHTHPMLKLQHKVDDEHVIVDKKDWDKFMAYMYNHPEIMNKMCNQNVDIETLQEIIRGRKMDTLY